MKKISLAFVIITILLLLPFGNIFASEDNTKINNVLANEVITNSESTKTNSSEKSSTTENDSKLKENNSNLKENNTISNDETKNTEAVYNSNSSSVANTNESNTNKSNNNENLSIDNNVNKNDTEVKSTDTENTTANNSTVENNSIKKQNKAVMRRAQSISTTSTTTNATNSSVTDNSTTNSATANTAASNTTENTTQEAVDNTPNSIGYVGHVQNIGWQPQKKDGEVAGTTGRALRMEAIKISPISKSAQYKKDNIKIYYQVHIQNIGWQRYVEENQVAGTTGRKLRIEAIKIKLSDNNDYSIRYRVHVQNIGWMPWKYDDEIAGTTGCSLRIEAIQIQIVSKVQKQPHVYYKSHVQNIGWQYTKTDGETSGTTGRRLRVESINISTENMGNIGIKYQVHVQDKGWMNWVKGGQNAGTTGRSLRVEAIRIKLDDNNKYSVQYRVHVQHIGWMPWKIDGEMAGTTGQSLRIEAIQIKITEKQKSRLNGVDVSEHNSKRGNSLNWDSIKSNTDFAILRLGWVGNDDTDYTYVDSKFNEYYNECKKRNIPIGVYVFNYCRDVNKSIRNANWVASQLKNKSINYGVYFDIENTVSGGKQIYDGVSNETLTAVVKNFCDTLKKQNYNTGFYTNKKFAVERLNMDQLSNHEFWIAQYNDTVTYTGKYKMWQYTSQGKIPGCVGNLDLNYRYK